MTTLKFGTSYNKPTNINPISEYIKNENILIDEVTIEYKKGRDCLVTHANGQTSLRVTPDYTKAVTNQITMLRNDIVIPLVRKVNSNFTVTAKVDQTGTLNLDELRLDFHVDCKKKFNTHETFRIPFKILLPFAEYIDYVNLVGHKHELAVIHAEVNVSHLELMDVIEQPIVGPKVKEQWFAFIMEAEKEASKEYKLNVVIPVSEGEITWKIPHNRKLQFFEDFKIRESIK